MRGTTHRNIALLSVVGLAVTAFPTLTIADTLIIPAVGLLVADAGGKIADIDIAQSGYGKKYPGLAKVLKHRGFTHTAIILLLMFAVFKLCGYMYDMNYGIWLEDILIMFIITGGLNVSIKTRLSTNLVVLLAEIFFLAFITMYNPMLINSILCSLVFGFFFAYASHLLADMHNRKGIPLAFPLCRKNIFLMAITTGTWEEYLFLGLYAIVIIGQIVCVKLGIGLLV